MKLKILQLNTYKSFFDSGQLSLEPGFNLVVGANNVGKTALLEAMSLNFANHPHRSILTIPWPGAQPAPNSTVQATFQLDPGEAKDLLIDTTEFFTIPSPTEPNDINQAHRWINGFESSDLLVVGLKGDGYISLPYLNSVGEISGSSDLGFRIDRGNRSIHFLPSISAPHYGDVLLGAVKSRIYAFRAERMNIGMCAAGRSVTLRPDASNLAETLHNLQSNPVRFDRFNQLVRSVFPQIGRVSAPNGPADGTAQILVWDTEYSNTEREDLACPLSESGTGISQVLAILYVIVTADRPRLIIIDEPQSFLHAGAARKLIEILKRQKQHQFVISTHSPEIMASLAPQRILLLQKRENSDKGYST